MATEEASQTAYASDSFAKWASWLAALVGLWVLVSPFVLSGSFGAGPAMWSNVASGVVVAVLSAYGAYTVRALAELPSNSPGEWSGWLAALGGLWMLVSPFVLSGTVGASPAKWSNVVVGVVAVVLAAYCGYVLHSET